MTQYLFKLARRMASAFATPGVVLLAACSEAVPRDFLDPDPTNPPPPSGLVSLHIAPKTGAIAANQPLQFRAWGRTASGDSVAVAASWTASGGQIGPDGVFTSAAGGSFSVQGFAIGKPQLSDAATVQVEAPTSIFSALYISPKPAAVPMGGTVTFSASAPLASGGMTVPSVSWTATGGTISPTGVYSAGMAPGTFQVVARTVDGVFNDTVAVQVQAASLQAMAVTPQALTVSSGELVDFVVAGQWNDGSTSPPAVQWTSTAGSISASGRLTAGGTPGVYRVVASHAPSARADTALVTIMPAVARIEISPASYQLQPGAQKAFTAVAVRTDGVVVPVAVSWIVTGGTISASGVYSAGSILGGGYRVIARYLGGVFADTAEVTIAAPAATLTGLSLTPGMAAVGSGAQVSFHAVPTWSDGSSTLPALVWTATGGAVSGDGTWTAPLQAGSYQVVVRHPASGLADTATVTVTEAPRVTAVTITAQASSIQTGGTRQFAAQATWSDGGSRPVEWLWSATGGTITVNGLFTAGNLAGQFMVVASCVGCAAADTTSVSVTSAPPPPATLTSLVLSPAQALLNPGDVLPLHVSASWSDGSTQVPDLAWTVGGGTRSGLNYTAGSSTGTFLVIARHSAGTLADTTVITIETMASTSPTLTSLVLNPSSVTMNTGEKRTLTVAATWSDGSTTLPPLAWDVTGGTLSGLEYTAGATAGNYRVIVRHQGGTKADTTAVTVVVSQPTLVSLQVSPGGASTPAGYSIPFTVTGKMSDSTIVTPTVTWTATGGTITSSGVYTAATAAGTFQVTAAHAASGLSAQQAITVTTSGGGSSAVELPEAPREFLNTTYQQPGGTVRNVAAGGNLQGTINAAQCGDRILLAAGATFTGAFTLPNKNCNGQWIEISTATTLPPEGTRVTPATASGYARIISPGSNQPALSAAAAAGYYRIMGIEFGVASSVTSHGAVVAFHVENLSSVAQIPHNIVLDRVIIRGHDTMHLRRCLLLNARRAALVDSHLSKCHGKGFDSQAVLLWDTPGPVKVVNNYLEGAGENMMIGGADPSIQGMVPSDIEIRRNHFFKPVSWYASGAWTVKNSFELKMGKRILIEGNIFENNWFDAQAGFAVLLKSTNQDGSAPWSETSNVMFRHNVVLNSPAGVAVAGNPEMYPAVPMSKVAFEDNLIYRLGESGSFGGTGRGFQVAGDIANLIIRQNTVLGPDWNGLLLYGARSVGTLDFSSNILQGIINSADGAGYGTNALNAHQTSWQARSNVIVQSGWVPVANYPAGTNFAQSINDVGFVSISSANFALSEGSPFAGKGATGRDPGVNFTALMAATLGVK